MFKERMNTRGLVILAVIAAMTTWIIMVSGVLAQDAGVPAVQSSEQYTVVVGDTLDTIAQSFNVSIISLFEVNQMDYGTVIFPGDTILIPSDGTPYGYYPGLSIGNPNGTAFYILQPLDVLDLVAAFFDIDLQCLAQTNGIEDPNDVEPGFMVSLPVDCPTYTGTSSMPLRPLRGAALTGASVRLIEGEVAPTATPTAFAAAATPTATAITPVIVLPTATTPGVIIETPVPGGIMRGPTVTPTPMG